jgi:hypothetical protein
VAYVAAYSGGLRVVDVSDPASPTETTSYDTPGAAKGLLRVGSEVFVADDSSLQILDVSSAPPAFVADYACGPVGDVAVAGHYAYVAESKGISVIDIATPARPRWIMREAQSNPQAVVVSGNYLYSAGVSFTIDDISDPASPVQVHSSTAVGGSDLALAGGVAYVTGTAAGLYVYDISTPASASRIATLDTPGFARAVALSGSIAYVADDSEGLQVVDVSTPASPSIIGTVATAGSAKGLTVSDRYLYVAENDAGIEIYDISVPEYPLWVGMYGAAYYANDVVVAGGLCYVADSSQGMGVLDISDPWAPVEVGYYDTDGSARNLSYSDGYVYFADGAGGAYIFHYSGACYDPYEANDSLAAAYPVVSGALYDSKICTAGDYDYYALTITQGGTIGAAMHPPAGFDYDLFLYSSAGTLLAHSMTAGDAAESLAYTTAAAGTYYLLVRGHDGTQFSGTRFYSLVPSFTACAAPAHALIIYMGRKDANDDVILDILDPNQPAAVTGYNIYRDTVPNPATWTLHAANVADADEGTANVQYIDLGSNAGGPYYYVARAVNADCGAEGP